MSRVSWPGALTRPLRASPAARSTALPAPAKTGLSVPSLISKKLPAAADTLTRIKRRRETSSKLSNARCYPTQRNPVKTVQSCRKYLEFLVGQGNAFFCPEMCLRLPVYYFPLPPPRRCGLRDALRGRFCQQSRLCEPGTCPRTATTTTTPPPRTPASQPLGGRRPPGSRSAKCLLVRDFVMGTRACIAPPGRACPARRLSCSIPVGISGFRAPSPICSPFAASPRQGGNAATGWGVQREPPSLAGSRGPDFCILAERWQGRARRCIPAGTGRASAPSCAA